MDFGEILKMWDAQARPPSPARAERESGKASRSAVDGASAREPSAGRAPSPVASAQEAWLDRHGVPEPAARGKDAAPEPRLSRRDIDLMPVDASLDLHGMTAREAEAALASFFAAAERTGCRKVMIVHGKGLHSASGPVLEGIMKRWLERRASAGKSGHADAANGGKGATWVLLKRKGNQRSR